ncbi:MAG: restriction endonuclease, partial [Acidobacteriota bacterium]|nr:restriction endonuclease [Acidobacteriota bacterium]
MSIARLREIVHSEQQGGWSDRNKEAFATLFGSPEGRYPKAASKVATVRAPEMNQDSGVSFAAYIPPSSPTSGSYSGLSFVMFPVP